MCQICEDFQEFDRAIDAAIAERLPRIMALPVDRDILRGVVEHKEEKP